uniref:Ribosomal protein S3 n=1 Tax=Synura petersenii TaxID=52555 RepID=A0A3G2QYM2_9STRA|nr:hypothetical protein [Synura petersenii]
MLNVFCITFPIVLFSFSNKTNATSFKKKIVESSKTIVLNELDEKSFSIYYKSFDYRFKLKTSAPKSLSISEKEIIFKKFSLKLQKLLFYLETSKDLSYNQLVIDNLLGNLKNSTSIPLKNCLENKRLIKEKINFNFKSSFYKNPFLTIRGGYLNEIFILINDNSQIRFNHFQKILQSKKAFKYFLFCCIIFLIFYLNKVKIEQFCFFLKSKLKFIKIFSQNLNKPFNKAVLKKFKLLKKIKFKPLEIKTGQKNRLMGKKSLKFIYEKIPKNGIKSFFKTLSNKIDPFLKIRVKFRPFNPIKTENEEVDFNNTITNLFNLLSEDI